jgi:cell division transport system permease protein
LNEADQNRLRDQIAGIAGVESVEFVSSQAALERMERVMELGPDERALLGGESRLPAKFAVQPADPAAIGAIAEQLEQLPGVQEVRYQENIVAPLNELRVRARQFGWTALLVLSLATCGIISNAIRLTLYARRREIRIMQLVGATDGFVRTPFVMEGVFHGLVGGLLALGVTAALYDQVREVNEKINPWLKTVTLGELMPEFALGLVFLGVAFGMGSSLISIRRFLREA